MIREIFQHIVELIRSKFRRNPEVGMGVLMAEIIAEARRVDPRVNAVLNKLRKRLDEA